MYPSSGNLYGVLIFLIVIFLLNFRQSVKGLSGVSSSLVVGSLYSSTQHKQKVNNQNQWLSAMHLTINEFFWAFIAL